MGQLKLALQVPTVDLTQIPTQLVAKLLLHSRRGMISYHGKAPLQSKGRRFLQQHLSPSARHSNVLLPRWTGTPFRCRL